MVANTDIPEVMESTSYTATLKSASDPIFLERALYLKDHGYFKELSVQELREELRLLYRKSEKLRDMLENDDVWK